MSWTTRASRLLALNIKCPNARTPSPSTGRQSAGPVSKPIVPLAGGRRERRQPRSRGAEPAVKPKTGGGCRFGSRGGTGCAEEPSSFPYLDLPVSPERWRFRSRTGQRPAENRDGLPPAPAAPRTPADSDDVVPLPLREASAGPSPVASRAFDDPSRPSMSRPARQCALGPLRRPPQRTLFRRPRLRPPRAMSR